MKKQTLSPIFLPLKRGKNIRTTITEAEKDTLWICLFSSHVWASIYLMHAPRAVGSNHVAISLCWSHIILLPICRKLFSPIFWSYRPSKHLTLHPAGRDQGKSTELVKAWSLCSLAWFLLIVYSDSAYPTCWKKHKFSLRLLFLNAESNNRPNSAIPGLWTTATSPWGAARTLLLPIN